MNKKEEGRELLYELGRGLVILFVIVVVLFGLIAGVCGVAIFTSR